MFVQRWTVSKGTGSKTPSRIFIYGPGQKASENQNLRQTGKRFLAAFAASGGNQNLSSPENGCPAGDRPGLEPGRWNCGKGPGSSLRRSGPRHGNCKNIQKVFSCGRWMSAAGVINRAQ